MLSPFSLFQRNTKKGKVWYARYFDASGRVIATRSTTIPCTGKKNRKIDAYKQAEIIRQSIEDQGKCPLLIPYLKSFWNESSPYVQSKRIAEKKALSSKYLELNFLGIKTHVLPYEPFRSIRIDQLTPGMIADWIVWMQNGRTGSKRTNDVLQAMRIPIRYLVYRGELKEDPFRNIKPVPYTPKEKGILNRDEIHALSLVKNVDIRVRLALSLAVSCGLRRGEVRGLRWMDINFSEGLLNIRNNYIDGEGSKGCKAGSERTVLLPQDMRPILHEIQSMSPFTAPEHFVLFHPDAASKPLSVHTIQTGFRQSLSAIGINRDLQRSRNLTFHGLRHTFITNARLAGLPDITVQALAGHRSADMMNHYSHAGQVIDFQEAREKLEGIVSCKERRRNALQHGNIRRLESTC